MTLQGVLGYMLEHVGAYVRLTRPFTLLAPAVGMVCGALAAGGSLARSTGESTAQILLLNWPRIFLSVFMAAVFNAASNTWNQYWDIETDRINKPFRPLPSGQVGKQAALIFSVGLYGVTLALAFLISPGGRHECLFIVAVAVVGTLIYSAPPLWFKRRGWWSNVTIALIRGVLLIAAGWSCVASVRGTAEPWFLGTVLGLFLLGAATTKDFADIEGDRATGCRTLPVVYGPERAVRYMSPWLVAPWFFLPLLLPVLRVNGAVLLFLALVLVLYGTWIVSLLRRNASALTRSSVGLCDCDFHRWGKSAAARD
jgi:4-hydroxybenzoate polyprenyltransferase